MAPTLREPGHRIKTGENSRPTNGEYSTPAHTAAETLATIAADPRHLGAQLGMTMVLHTWGQTLQHHPHVHCVVPGGGPSLDGTRWVACRPNFFLPVRVLSRLFRRLFLQKLKNAFGAGKLRFRQSPRTAGLRTSPARTPAPRLGGLRQASVRSARAGAGLSRPLHPSCRHRQ